MEAANTLAYYNMVTINGVKGFMVKAPGVRLYGYKYRSPPF